MKVLYLSFIIVIFDQVTKLIVKGFSIPFLNFNYDGMYIGQTIPVIGDFFRITFIENPGMAFGYDPGSAFKFWVTLFSLLASIGLIIYIYVIKEKSLSLRIAIALILGGALGNLIDRMFYGIIFDYAPLFYGRVVDFLDVDIFDFTLFGKSFNRWPIFNIADAAVTSGVLILILFYRKHQREEDELSAESKVVPENLTGTKTSANSVNTINNFADDLAADTPDSLPDGKTNNGKDIQD
ncbi:MAG TPA: signal peptidase II [Ignavibacteriaceae bacterium]|nr:signal peptidase II [Ignavibacteriaceae bacterium]